MGRRRRSLPSGAPPSSLTPLVSQSVRQRGPQSGAGSRRTAPAERQCCRQSHPRGLDARPSARPRTEAHYDIHEVATSCSEAVTRKLGTARTCSSAGSLASLGQVQLAFRPVGFANSSAALRGVELGRFGALVVVEGGLIALVVCVSRCSEPVRAGVAAGAAASLEGTGDSLCCATSWRSFGGSGSRQG